MALFNKNKTLRPRSYSGAGVGSGKCRKLDRLEDRTPWRVKTQGCSRRTARFIFRAGFLLGSGGGKNSMIFQPSDVCLVDGSFPKQKKTIQMMRLPNMMVSPTQVLDDGCFYCLLSYLKKRCKPLFSISQLKIHSLNKMGGMFIYWPENIQYSSGLDKIRSWSFKITL